MLLFVERLGKMGEDFDDFVLHVWIFQEVREENFHTTRNSSEFYLQNKLRGAKT